MRLIIPSYLYEIKMIKDKNEMSDIVNEVY